MGTRRGASGIFQAEAFTKSLAGLIDSLPSDTEKQQIISQLQLLIQFLGELKSRVEAVPSRQDSAAVRTAVDTLRDLFDQARNNPVLGAVVGIKAAARRPKESALTQDEIESARATLVAFDSMPIDELRTKLSNMTPRELQAIANAIGIRTTRRTAHDALAHQIATKISNTRGYQSLRDGTE